jgi:hypothetical protein
MTVQAQQLDVVPFSVGNRFPELHSIEVDPLFCAAPIYVIEFQNTVIFHTAVETASAKLDDGGFSRWTPSPALADPAEFADTVGVSFFPTHDEWFLTQVVAPGTSTAFVQPGFDPAVDTEVSDIGHDENPSRY